MQEITFVSKHSNEDKEDVFKYELTFNPSINGTKSIRSNKGLSDLVKLTTDYTTENPNTRIYTQGYFPNTRKARIMIQEALFEPCARELINY